MKPISFLLESVFVSRTKTKGRGIFCDAPIKAKTVIEIAPVIVLNAEERKMIDQTLLHDYIFEWGEDRRKCCMALGYVPLYNHAFPSNCEYEMDFRKKLITIKAVRDIVTGEELFINYNGDWNSGSPVWFNAH